MKMTQLDRHCYSKVNNEWVIVKTYTLEYQKIPYNIATILECSRRLRQVLTPDLLTKKYRLENETNPMYGHCYHTTQAMFYLLDTHTLDPIKGRDWRGDDHWWLKDKENGFIVDMTADQYYSIDKEPPYDRGKVSSWYGWKQRPHKRTLDLITRLQMDSYLAVHCPILPR